MFRFVLLSLLLAFLPVMKAEARQRPNCACFRSPCTECEEPDDDPQAPEFYYSDCSEGDEVASPRPKLNGKEICMIENLRCTREKAGDRNSGARFKNITAVCYPNRAGGRCPDSSECANRDDIDSDSFCDIKMGNRNSSERDDRRANSCNDSDADTTRVNPLCDRDRDRRSSSDRDSRRPPPPGDLPARRPEVR